MDELEAVDRYCDRVPRPWSVVEEHGTMRLFVPRAGHPWYARPSGPRPVAEADVTAVLARQRGLGLPESVEWVGGRPDGLDALCAQAGLTVHRYPLLAALPGALRPPATTPAEVRLLGTEDDLGAAAAVGDVGFAHEGTAVGEVGAEAVDAARPTAEAVAVMGRRVAAGRPALAGAYEAGRLVARGGHTLDEGVSEITGVTTLPAHRRRGLGAAVTAVLAADAVRRGAGLVWLSADSDDVARVYERLGFRRIGWSGAAER